MKANTFNYRSIKKRNLARLRAAMKNGEWDVTHQGIAFSVTGVLLDGQHRLQAIIDTGVGQLIHVFVGLPDEVRKGMDNGKPRELRDHLDGDPAHIDACAFLANLMNTAQDRPPSVDEVEALMDGLGDDLDALEDASAKRVKGRTPAPVRAVWAVRHHQAGKSAREFLKRQWNAFVTLSGGPHGMDPLTGKLASRLEGMAGSGGGTASRLRAKIAWVAFNPRDRDKSKIQISSDKPIWELRDAITDVLDEEEL